MKVATVLPQAGFSQDELLNLAASAEGQSTHILARSLTDAVPAADRLPASEVSEATSFGVYATVDGHKVKVGKAEFAGAKRLWIQRRFMSMSMANMPVPLPFPTKFGLKQKKP